MTAKRPIDLQEIRRRELDDIAVRRNAAGISPGDVRHADDAAGPQRALYRGRTAGSEAL